MRSAPHPLSNPLRADPDAVPRRLRRAMRHARSRVFRPGRDLRVLGRGGATIPTRPRTPNSFRRRMVDHRKGSGPTGSRAGAVPGRCVRTRRDHARPGRAPPARRDVEALPSCGRRRRAGRRRARARRRHRPRARRRGSPVRVGRQRTHAIGDLVRGREPAGNDARLSRAVRVAPRPAGRRLPGAVVGSSAGHRAHRSRRPHGGGAHAGRAQRGLLRALVPGRPDGCGARGRPRPRVPRQPRVHAHNSRRGTSARRVPPRRR